MYNLHLVATARQASEMGAWDEGEVRDAVGDINSRISNSLFS